jgi:aminopeptidase N
MEHLKNVRKAICLVVALTSLFVFAQAQERAQPKAYRGSSEKINTIIATKLDIGFVFEKQILTGKAWLTIQPYSTAQNYLELNAKNMLIKRVEIQKGTKIIPLRYQANGKELQIHLDRYYKSTEPYLLYVEYQTNPVSLGNNFKSALHFVNPSGLQIGTPTQIWTSGQPENNSSWFPTIDRPNQKMMQEISITVPVRFSTLSNGKLQSKKMLSQGLRKDTWKMDRPHAPYLFMLAVGEFKIVKDYWKGKEVSYYLEPAFFTNEKTAREAFPNTVEAIEYFSNLLGVKYPWEKYSQIKLRGFSGAMEHTTASSFNEDKQSTPRELRDKNYEPGNIHELFHQWFGNYVTAESWANICLNESFADLSEIIWAEHKFGSDVSGDHLLKGMRGYLTNSDSWDKNLVRFDYNNPQEVFDGVSYQKGGRILNMLRIFLGDKVFYKGLHLYLTRNAYKSAEVHHLRLALEEASGQDLNWFFDQWFYRSGHPVLDINYGRDKASGQNFVVIQQKQEGSSFRIPLEIDIYSSSGMKTKHAWVSKTVDTIFVGSGETPMLINVDAQKALVAKKTDHKTLLQFAFQYSNAPLLQDRYEAVEAAKSEYSKPIAREILKNALKDKFYSIRNLAINSIDLSDSASLRIFLPEIVHLAKSDSNNSTRALAVNKLGSLKSVQYLNLFVGMLSEQSYLISGEALMAIGQINPRAQFDLAKKYKENSKGKLAQAILQSFMTLGGDEEWSYVYSAYTNGNSAFQYSFTRQLADFIKKIKYPSHSQDGVRALLEVVTIEKNISMIPRLKLFLDDIKASKVLVKDAATVKVIEELVKELKDISESK